MKKIIFSVLILSGSLSFYAQTKWDLNGNSVSGSNFIGTTNNEALVLKANNTIGLKVKPNGELIFKSLDLNSSTGPNGLVLTDGQGVISRLDFLNNGNKVLYSDGTWGTLPAGSNLWQESTGSKIYYSGKVGINTSSPNYQLDVNGDARISNNLYVGGGILITRKIEASASLKTDTIQSMSGETKFTSKVILKNQFQVDGTTLFNGTVQANNLYVNGYTNFASPIIASQGLRFDANNGIKFTPANGAMGSITHIGPIGPGIQPILSPCDFPTQDPWFFFGGRINLFDPASNVSLTMGSDSYQSSIDAAGNNGLVINYYCGKDVSMCTGANGGTVAMGNKVNMAQSLKIGLNGSPSVIDPNTSLEINQNTNGGNGLKFKTYNNGVKLISIENASSQASQSPFTVFGDGNTVINCGVSTFKYFRVNDASGTSAPRESFTIRGDGRTDLNATAKLNKYFVINDVSTSSSPIESFAVYGDGRTNIGSSILLSSSPHFTDAKLTVGGKLIAKEIYVVKPAYWSDFVFNETYTLLPLDEVEAFYKKNNHLPNVPSENNVMENGIGLADMDATLLQKIEELTLYIVQQNKEIKELKKLITKNN